MQKLHKKIAIIANGWSNEFVAKVIESVHKEAEEDNVDIFVFLSYIAVAEDELQNKCQLNLLHLPNPTDFDGVISVTNSFNIPDEKERVCALFRRSGIPMVSLEVPIEGVPTIYSENYKGMFNLSMHLIEKHNVKNVVYIGGNHDNVENLERKKALIDALRKHNLELMNSVDGDFGFPTAKRIIEKWFMDGKKLPDAFVCANDLTAMGVCDALHEAGYTVPDDVIVTGFDGLLEGKTSFPMLATVSRGWDDIGGVAYRELQKQIKQPGEIKDIVIESSFVPSESCGCPACDVDKSFRIEECRHRYQGAVSNTSLSYFTRRLSLNVSKIFCKDDFHDLVKREMEEFRLLKDDYWICTEPAFFEVEDEEYPDRIRGYSKEMDVLYSRKNRQSVLPFTFNSKELVPGYKKDKNKSDIYVLVPMNHLDFIIGYVVAKNSLDMVYDHSFFTYVTNINVLFIQIRRFIFAERVNNELKSIYMRDALTNLYNRTGCYKVLYSFIEEQKNQSRNTLLLFVDVNCMKDINDIFGHLKGDMALKATAEALTSYLPKDWKIARFGGDEFVAVGDCCTIADIEVFSEMLEANMGSYFNKLELDFPLSVSIGFELITSDDERGIDDYVQAADESMYGEKECAHQILKDQFDEIKKAKLHEDNDSKLLM